MKWLLLISASLAGVLVSIPAGAAPITFNFSGTVDSVSHRLRDGFFPGDAMSGYVTFDSDLTDLNSSDSTHGQYGPITALELTIRSFTVSLHPTGDNFIVIFSDPVNVFQIGAEVRELTPSAQFARLVNLRVFGPAGSVATDALMTVPPDPSVFTSSSWSVGFLSADVIAGSNLTFVSPSTVVPEPSTLSLLGGGLAGLASLRKRRRQSVVP